MNKKINEGLEVNYVCNNCGQKIFNATRKMVNCDKCGRRLKEVNPIGVEKEKENK
jgi:DNA-directed RNA polymerase subunit RPC12/RpoP